MSGNSEDRDPELAARVEALSREIEPSRDLWTAVQARIEAKKSARRARVVPIGVAVGIVALAASWIAWVGRTPRPVPQPAPIASIAPTPPAPASASFTPLVPEEASFTTAITALHAQIDPRLDKLPPAKNKAIHVSLDALTSAIATTRAALAAHPDDADLRDELDAEYEQEIQTLNDVLEWTTRT